MFTRESTGVRAFVSKDRLSWGPMHKHAQDQHPIPIQHVTLRASAHSSPGQEN